MRISKLSPLAVAMAGAFALAACGGGDGMSDDDGNGGGNGGGGGGNGELKELKLPAAADFERDQSDAEQGTIPAGGTEDIGNVRLTCPTGTAPCAYEVRSGKIYANNGVVPSIKPPAPALEVTGNTAQPTGTLDPLSNAVLLEALKVGTGDDASVPTPWSAKGVSFDSEVTGANGKTLMYVSPGTNPKERIDLTVQAEAGDIYWGHWYRRTDGVVVTDERTNKTRGTVFGGAKRYDEKPHDDVASATYGTNVHLYYKKDDDKDWGTGTASLELMANFGAGMVGGKIEGVAAATGRTGTDDDIRLKDTAIGANGTFEGDATFMKAAGRQDGEWNGAFYNEAGKPVDPDLKPDHVAGEFSATKEKKDGDHDLTVHGAFGG